MSRIKLEECDHSRWYAREQLPSRVTLCGALVWISCLCRSHGKHMLGWGGTFGLITTFGYSLAATIFLHMCCDVHLANSGDRCFSHISYITKTSSNIATVSKCGPNIFSENDSSFIKVLVINLVKSLVHVWSECILSLISVS